MKKLIFSIAVIALLVSTSSCGTVFGGKISDCQKHKPATGSREVRVGALVADIFFGGGIGLIVDFADGGMYKPCADNAKNK